MNSAVKDDKLNIDARRARSLCQEDILISEYLGVTRLDKQGWKCGEVGDTRGDIGVDNQAVVLGVADVEMSNIECFVTVLAASNQIVKFLCNGL